MSDVGSGCRIIERLHISEDRVLLPSLGGLISEHQVGGVIELFLATHSGQWQFAVAAHRPGLVNRFPVPILYFILIVHYLSLTNLL